MSANDDRVHDHNDDQIKIKIPGVFGRTVERLENRPIATSLGLGVLGGTVAFAGYNLRRFGTMLPPSNDTGDVVVEAAASAVSLVGKLFGR